MHQSFATTSPSGPGNSGDIDFSLSKARVYAQHCRDTLMVKALPKSPLKSRQVNVNFHGHFGTGIKTPAIPRHCGDNAEVKTLQLSPAMPPLFSAQRGRWLQMTGALGRLSSRKRTDQFRIHYMLSVLVEAMAIKVNYKISPFGCQNSMIT